MVSFNNLGIAFIQFTFLQIPHLTMDTLGVQLYPSRYRVGSGLSPFRTCAHRVYHVKSLSGEILKGFI
jgi:hypothetical protein